MSDRYSIVLADPAWLYSDPCRSGERGAGFKYPQMKLADIKALRVQDLAADNALLYLWAVPPMLPEALEVMAAWGFKYKTFAFTWIKTTSKGTPAFGMGHYTRANAEVVLLGKRGKGVPVIDHGVNQVVLAPRREHSRKPDEVRDRIDQLHASYLDGVGRVELFARAQSSHDGWDLWGNDPEIVGTQVSQGIEKVLRG